MNPLFNSTVPELPCSDGVKFGIFITSREN